MDRDRSGDKINENTDKLSGAEPQSDRSTRLRSIDDEAWKTRVFEMDQARMNRRHTWIGEEEDAADLRRTVVVKRSEIAPPLSEQMAASGEQEQQSGKDAGSVRRKRSMRKIRIGDRKRFRRLLIILAVLAVIIALEASFFAMDARVSKLPDEIKTVNEQVEDVKADNKKIKKENKELGDKAGKEELRDSWERMRDKLKEAVGETSS